jgi:hypothetical protein
MNSLVFNNKVVVVYIVRRFDTYVKRYVRKIVVTPTIGYAQKKEMREWTLFGYIYKFSVWKEYVFYPAEKHHFAEEELKAISKCLLTLNRRLHKRRPLLI